MVLGRASAQGAGRGPPGSGEPAAVGVRDRGCLTCVVEIGSIDSVDPVSLIVSAIALGASNGVRDTVASAVRDAYDAVKRLLQQRYADVDVTAVERRPDSEPKRNSLVEDLDEAGAGADAELLEAARQLIAQVREHDPDAGRVVGIDLERVVAESLRISDVASTGAGVRVRDSQFRGDVDIQGVRSGEAPPGPLSRDGRAPARRSSGGRRR